MTKARRTTLLIISTIIVAAIIFASAISIKPTSAADSLKLFSIRSLTSVDKGDHLQISFGVNNEANQPVNGNGTAMLTIIDNSSRTLYVGNFTFAESYFQDVSTPNGSEPIVVWNLSYDDMNHSFAKGGEITCNLSLTSKEWTTNDTKVTIPMPATLSVVDLYYRSAMPEDQEHMMIDNKIQGGISYEPYVSEVVNKGWGKVLLRSSEVWPGHPSYVLLLDRTWAQRNPDLAARTVKAHMDAELWIQNALADPNSSNYTYLIDMGRQIMQKSKMSAAVIADSLKDIEFSYNLTNTSKSYVKLYTDGWIKEGLISNQSLQNLSYQDSEDFANSYVNSSYIPMALNATPSDSILGNVSMGFVKGNIFMLPTFVALNTSLWGGETAFEKYGVKVVSPEPTGYNTSALVEQAFLKGDIDVGFTGICPAILDRIQFGMNTIIAAQMTANGTALVVKNNINSVEDLAGKTIASVDPVTIQNIFMMHIAEKYGFQLIPVDQGGRTNSTES